jgi:aspartyl-tRNA(Asn)/glutamyl-tRNA(Gln) amidotransferase subunit B
MDPHSTYVDLNRSGTALMEIVSRPDMRSAEDAAAYVRTLRTLLRALGHLRRRHGEGQPRAT